MSCTLFGAPSSLSPTSHRASALGFPLVSSSAARPTPNRRSVQRRETHHAILEAAEQLLVEEGYESFSMRKLAARSGCTPPTLYHHFQDKLGLLDAVLERRMEDAVEAFRRAELGSDEVENLRRLFRTFADWGTANPTHYELLTVHRQRAEALPAAEEARRMLEQPVAALSQAGRLATDVDTASQAFWALVHGLISLRGSRPDVEWSPSLTEASLDAMIRGLVLPESSR